MKILILLFILLCNIVNAQNFIGTNTVEYINSENHLQNTGVLYEQGIFEFNKAVTNVIWRTTAGNMEFIITDARLKSKNVIYYTLYSNSYRYYLVTDFDNGFIFLLKGKNETYMFNIQNAWEE